MLLTKARGLICSLVLVFICEHSIAGDPEFGSLEWVREVWAASDRLELPENSYIEWEYEEIVSGSEAELRQLEQRVAGKPHHPDLKRLRQLRSVLIDDAPLVTTHRLWYESAERFRLSKDNAPVVSVPYIDFAVNREDYAWSLVPRQLRVEPPKEDISGFPVRARLMAIEGMWPRFHFGIGASGYSGDKPRAVKIDGEQWICTVGNDEGDRILEYRGTIDVDSRLLAINEVWVVKLPSGDTNRIGMKYLDHAAEPSIHGVLPPREIYSFRDNGNDYTRRLLTVRPLESNEIESLIQVPLPDGTDPIRGSSTYTELIDKVGVVSYGSPTTDVVAGAARAADPGVEQPRPEPQRRPAGNRITILAVGIMGGITVVLVVWRIRTRTG